MRFGEWNRLVRDMTRHIRERYSSGIGRVYQYILLPELAMAVMGGNNNNNNGGGGGNDNNDDVATSHASSIMNYVLKRMEDGDFPIVDPELYETILSNGRHRDRWTGGSGGETSPGRDRAMPYHKLLSRLVSSGESIHSTPPKKWN